MGLDPARHLGKELEVLEPYLHKLKEYAVSSLIASCTSLISLSALSRRALQQVSQLVPGDICIHGIYKLGTEEQILGYSTLRRR